MSGHPVYHVLWRPLSSDIADGAFDLIQLAIGASDGAVGGVAANLTRSAPQTCVSSSSSLGTVVETGCRLRVSSVLFGRTWGC